MTSSALPWRMLNAHLKKNVYMAIYRVPLKPLLVLFYYIVFFKYPVYLLIFA